MIMNRCDLLTNSSEVESLLRVIKIFHWMGQYYNARFSVGVDKVIKKVTLIFLLFPSNGLSSAKDRVLNITQSDNREYIHRFLPRSTGDPLSTIVLIQDHHRSKHATFIPAQITCVNLNRFDSGRFS